MTYEELFRKLEHLPFRLEFGNLKHLQLVESVKELREKQSKNES